MVNNRNIKYKVKELWIEFPKQLILFQLFLFFCLLSRFLVILPLTFRCLAFGADFSTELHKYRQISLRKTNYPKLCKTRTDAKHLLAEDLNYLDKNLSSTLFNSSNLGFK